MSNEIKKINDLSLVESFLQVNFIKGYKYVDRAGEIVNAFYKNDQAPAFDMSLSGLVIFDPESDIKTVKVSSNMFWAHFLSPGSLELIENNFTKKSKTVYQILEVEKMNRIGWRNYFVKEIVNESKREEILKKFSPSANLKFDGGIFSCDIKNNEVKIRIKKVQKNDETEVPALLFDIDVSDKKLEGVKITELDNKLIAIKNVLRSEELLNILNELIK